jgi:hypothetical protein
MGLDVVDSYWMVRGLDVGSWMVRELDVENWMVMGPGMD